MLTFCAIALWFGFQALGIYSIVKAVRKIVIENRACEKEQARVSLNSSGGEDGKHN